MVNRGEGNSGTTSILAIRHKDMRHGTIFGISWLGLFWLAFCPLMGQPDYDRLIEKGMEYAARGDYALGIPVFLEAIEINSDRVEGHYGLGYCYSLRCYEEKQNCQEAKTEFTTAIAIDPSYRHAYFNRAVARTYLDDWEGALQDLNKQINRDPSHAMYFSRRAEVLYLLGRYEEACSDIRHVRRLGGAYAHEWFDSLCPEG